MERELPELKKVDKSLFDNSWYSHGASFFKRTLWYYVNATFFISEWFPFYSLKVWLLRRFGAGIGNRCIIKPGVNIKHPWFLKIGDFVSIGEGVWIDNLAMVTLADHVTISQGAMLVTGNHNYKKVSFDLMVSPIILEEGTWIGARAIVGPGVVCRSHSILTAGSVAVSNLDPYTINGGNPAKIKRIRVLN